MSDDDKDTNVSTPYEDLCTTQDCNPAHGGCTCECHSPGSHIMHMVPCCYPADDEEVEEEIVPVKIDISAELRSRSFASHVVLSSLQHATLKRLAVANHDDEGLTISLKANGYEMDFLKFCKRMEEQMDRMILEKATEIATDLVAEQFCDISELANDLESRLKGEINKHLEDWESPL